jgi:transcriptional regulator GlxA family with amidase domain
MRRKEVAIVAYDGVAAINIAGPVEVLSSVCSAETSDSAPAYSIRIVSCSASRVVTDSGVALGAEELASVQHVEWDTVIVPGGSGIHRPQTCIEVTNALRHLASRSRRIASICSGIYALAPTGLLDNRRVTTHWRYAKDVAERFPQLRVEESEILIADDQFYTAAGATAGIDLALALVSADFGHSTALRIARNLLVYLNRDGGQEQYSEPVDALPPVRQATQVNVDRMDKVMRWIIQNLGDELRIESLAQRAMLAKNAFVQEFAAYFGAPPGLFIKTLRFNEARRRLLCGNTATAIATELGFRDPNYFIQEFRRRFGALPDEYQRRFRGRTEDCAQQGSAP